MRTGVPLVPSPTGASPTACCIRDFVWVKSPMSPSPRVAPGMAEERLQEMKAQEGAQLGLLLEPTVQGRCLAPRDTPSSASSSPPHPLPTASPASFSHLLPRTPPLHCASRGAIFLAADLGCSSGSGVPGPGLETLIFNWGLERNRQNPLPSAGFASSWLSA